MSSVAPLRTPSDQTSCTIGKAGEPPCNANDNLKSPDCYESMHAFKKIRTSTSGLRKSPNKWTKEENQKLAALVAHYGEKKWKRISAEMGGQKTGAQCAQHWKRVLSPEIRKGHWDENEEDLLLRLVHQYGSCWKKIAKKIPQRTDIQCRYQFLKAKQSREVKWDSKEDESLIKKVMEMANCSSFKIINDNNCNNNTNNFYEPSNSNYTTSLANNPPTNHNHSPVNMLKEDDRRLSLSSSNSDISDDRSSCSDSGSGDDKSNARMRDSSEIKPPISASTNSNENVSFNGLAMNKVVWLEIAEHMARMKLTSTLRTALECKTRFTELLSSNIVLSSTNSDHGKYFDLKGSGGISNGDDKPRGNDTNININISNNSDYKNNNITINNYSRNITINITNNLNNSTNGNGITGSPLTNHLNNNNNSSLSSSLTNLANNFNSLGSGAFSPSYAPGVAAMKKEPANPLDAPRAPTSLRAPSFPTFPHFPPVAQPLAPTAKPSRNVPSGLESLAAVASILPREMLAGDYAQF